MTETFPTAAAVTFQVALSSDGQKETRRIGRATVPNDWRLVAGPGGGLRFACVHATYFPPARRRVRLTHFCVIARRPDGREVATPWSPIGQVVDLRAGGTFEFAPGSVYLRQNFT